MLPMLAGLLWLPNAPTPINITNQQASVNEKKTTTTTKVSTYSFEATEPYSLDKVFSSCKKPKNKS